MALIQHETNGLVYFTSPQIDTPHGFSTRKGGVSLPPYDSLDLGPNRGDDPAAVLENSRRFCAAIGADVERTVLSAQVHETAHGVVFVDGCPAALNSDNGNVRTGWIVNASAFNKIRSGGKCRRHVIDIAQIACGRCGKRCAICMSTA